MDVAELVAERHRAGSAVVGGDLQTDVADGPRAHAQIIQKHWGHEGLPLPTTDEESSPWTNKKQPAHPPTYYKGGTATRIGDILISSSLLRANYAGDYLAMAEDDTLNGSDHRTVILHPDTGTYLDMSPGAHRKLVGVVFC